MAREINSRGVKYVGIYIRELPWKLTADVAAQVCLEAIENANSQEYPRGQLGSKRETFLKTFDLRR